jgi:hypothetical protein
MQLVVAVAAASVLLGGGTVHAAAPAPAAAHVATIKVAQFNSDISDEYPLIPASQVARAIKKSGADVVGIEEGGGEIPRIARALGWRYYDVRMQIVSRLPLVDPPGGGGLYTFVQVSPGRVVAMENVHLPSYPYGPYWVKNGKTAAQVIAMERRFILPAIEPDLTAARTLHARGIPVFLTGDFNSPSFRDWTKATVGIRPYMRYPVRWPVSVAVEQAGFTDSFRAIHPNPVTTPGLTWPVHRSQKGLENFGRAPKDRIDFVYADGATTTASRIIGEPGDPGASGTVSPWPSDHRLVVSTFRVTGATPPTLVTVPSRRVRVGQPVPVAFHSSGAAAGSVAIEHLGGGHATVVASRHVSAAAAGGIGRTTFSSAAWKPGAYVAVLRGTAGQTLSTFPFWVAARGALPTVATSQAGYAPGTPIRVAVRNAPGNRWDWLGIYHRGANPLVASYILWTYTHSTVDGNDWLGPDAHGPWPLPAGKYSVYLLRDDLYVKLAGANFSVR